MLEEENSQPDTSPVDTTSNTNSNVEPNLTFEIKGSTLYSVIDGIAVFLLSMAWLMYVMFTLTCNCCSSYGYIGGISILTITLATIIGVNYIDNSVIKSVKFIDGGIVEFISQKKSIIIEIAKIEKMTYFLGMIIMRVNNRKLYVNCRKLKSPTVIFDEITKMCNSIPASYNILCELFYSLVRIAAGICAYSLVFYILLLISSEDDKSTRYIDGDKQYIASNTIGELRIIPKVIPVEEIYKSILIYRLPGNKDDDIGYKFVFINNQLVFCPGYGKYITGINGNGSKWQISLKKYMKKDEHVFNISAFDGDKIIVNTCLTGDIDQNLLYDNEGSYIFTKIKPVKTLIINVSSRKISRLAGFIQANSNYKSSSFAALESNKKAISILDKNNAVLHHVKLNTPLIGNWDYDGGNNLIGYLSDDSMRAIIINPVTKREIKIDLQRPSYDITLKPDEKEIWVSTTGNSSTRFMRNGLFKFYYETFDYNNEVVMYDYNGKYIGSRIKADATGYSVKPMMNANTEMMKLYAACEKLVKQKGDGK